jgi:hypothetical protein
MDVMNAIIKNASITFESHGFLTVWLELDFGDGFGQSFGGYALYHQKSVNPATVPNYAGHFIWRCMEIAGVSEWSAIPGKSIRVRKPSENENYIEAIGHIIKDDWFCPKEEFLKLREKAE